MGSEGKSRKRRSSPSPSPSPSREEDEKGRKHRNRDGEERRRNRDDDEDDDRKKKAKKAKKTKSSDRSHKDKKSKENHGKHRKKDSDSFVELSKDDYFSKNNEFSTWLKEKKGLYFSDLSSEQARDQFSGFMKDWNNHKLESRYYEGIASGPRTAHNWKIRKDNTMRGVGRRGEIARRDLTDQLRSGGSLEDDHSTHSDDDVHLPSVTRHTHTSIGSSSSSAPAILGDDHTAPIGNLTIPSDDPTTLASRTPTSATDALAIISGCAKPHIQLVNGALHPSDVCARKITFIFREKMDDNGYCWKNVSKETKEFYWNEFQKHFVWDESISSLVKMAWQPKAAERYRAMMCGLRKKKEKTMHVSDSAWRTWNEAWGSPEFKLRSTQFSANRRSETGGSGSGISRHTGGSISHALHAERLRLRLGRDPLPYELFMVTHMRKGTSELVDARAQAIKDRYLELMEQSSQPQEEQKEPPIVDEMAIYYEAVGGEKKRRIYGVGSQSSVFYPQSSQRSALSTFSEALQTEVRELRDTIDQLQQGNQQLQQSLAAMQEKDQQREHMMERMQAMMMKMEATMFTHSGASTHGGQPIRDA